MILFCPTYLRSNVKSDKLWRTKSVAIMRKFSHWLASFVNRERRNSFSFLQSILIYVPNETEFKALGFYEPFDWIHFLQQPESTTRCTGPVFHDFVRLSPRPHAYTPKGGNEEKRNRRLSFILLRLDFAARDPTIVRTFLFSIYFLPSPLLWSLRKGWFIFLHDPRKWGEGDSEDDEDYRLRASSQS